MTTLAAIIDTIKGVVLVKYSEKGRYNFITGDDSSINNSISKLTGLEAVASKTLFNLTESGVEYEAAIVKTSGSMRMLGPFCAEAKTGSGAFKIGFFNQLFLNNQNNPNYEKLVFAIMKEYYYNYKTGCEIKQFVSKDIKF